MNRREMMRWTGLAAAGLTAGLARMGAAAEGTAAPAAKKRIVQAACPGAFGKRSLEEKAQLCAKLGLKGIDLIGPDGWETLKKNGLLCTMVPSHPLPKGFNHVENHDECIAKVRASIDGAAANGFPNVICFSGNRAGISDEEGLKNCVTGLKKVIGYAEEKKVTLCMELLNSKRNHKDYQCDHTAWGAEVCKGVGSERMKLLYDIYHMQIMEGDVIATIREFVPYIGHIHTAGVPGRHEIDESQELFYPAIMKAIAESGYTGYVAHEYSPTGEAVAALEKAIRICDV